MPLTWRIERVDERHWRALRDVRLAALQADPSAFASTLERELALTEESWRAWTRTSACFLAWESEGGGQHAIGLAAGADRQDGADAELVALWVDPEHRAMGVGEALVSAVVEWARAGRRGAVGLWVTTANSAGIGLYERLGFVPTGATQPLPSDPQLTEVEYRLQLH